MMGDINEYTDVIYEEEQFSDIDGDINASNFKDALKKWATTGNEEKMSSKNVVNVLLIGADSRQGTNTGNTDVMMLVSLNKKTKQIKLVSFLRDSYLYVEGKNNAYCMKLNAAFSMGGPEILMNTIENNYKIEIDDFVMVNFESFKSIIEAMDGVTVDVQKYEANYANNRYHMSMPYGDDVTLTGEEALAFCRIRGCDADGDVSRTRRQRQVINAIMDRVKSASVSDLNKYLNALYDSGNLSSYHNIPIVYLKQNYFNKSYIYLDKISIETINGINQVDIYQGPNLKINHKEYKVYYAFCSLTDFDIILNKEIGGMRCLS